MPWFWYYIPLAIAAVLTAWVAWRTPRGVFWVACLAASFIVSVAYLHAPKPWGVWLPPQPGIAMLCDAAVVVAIYAYGREKWETVGLRWLLMLSVTLNFVQTAAHIVGFPPIIEQDTYGILLEGINYLALAVIMVTGILDRANGRTWVPRFARGPVGLLGRLAHQKGWDHPPLSRW